MQTSTEQAGNGAVERSAHPDPWVLNRQAVLAGLGEAYLELEAHQASVQECVSRIQQLRALLQRTERELQMARAGEGEP